MSLSWIGWFVLAFFLSHTFTFVVIRFATAFGIVDRPDLERKIHKQPVPELGGMAIYASLAFVLVLVLASSDALTLGEIGAGHYSGFLLGGLVLMVGGFLDDRFRLPAKITFWFPVVAALLVIGFGVEISKLTNPLGGVIYLEPWQSDILVFVWLIGVMYTTKLLDGLDGLATGISSIGAVMVMMLALTRAYYQPDVALLAFISVGALTGFLVWNLHPAKIFLGEGGSTFVGFLLGTLAVISGGKLAIAILVLGIPALDTAWVIIRRFRKGGIKQIIQADRKHLHHRLLDLGWSQQRIVLSYFFVSIIFGGTALFMQSQQKVIALGLLVLLMIVTACALVVKERSCSCQDVCAK